MKLKNIFGHFKTITKHRHKVMALCFKAGIPMRGLLHDLSKYSPEEFFEGVKYYAGGVHSPIRDCKKINGYSKAWLHHTGRNKHHFEYWYDPAAPTPAPVMPYEYTAEMICDTLAAGMNYQGKNWTKEYQLGYFLSRKDKSFMNDKIKDVLKEVYEEVAEHGIDKVINEKNLKRIYAKHVLDKKESEDK